MPGETDLKKMLKQLKPILNSGEYVYVSVPNFDSILRRDTLFEFQEEEGITLILEKNKADALQLPYEFVCSWICLEVHSSLESVGLTAAFSTALAESKISCNVVAGYYHDHLFVAKKHTEKALEVLRNLSKF